MKDYLSSIQEKYSGSALWDYLHYDDFGDLWINNLRIVDAVAKYGSPLEIHDLTIMKRRADEWRQLSKKISDDVGHSGDFSFYYASKANMSMPYVKNACKHGWFAETSSAQDLLQLLDMYSRGIIDKDIPIICNGFKFPVAEYSPHGGFKSTEISFSQEGALSKLLPSEYSESIVSLFNQGFHILPILDTGELPYFAEHVQHGVMDVGLRLKFGIVDSDASLDRAMSRHGMTWAELESSAEQLSQIDNLSLKMLHIMVSAAQVTPIDELVSSVLFGVEKYFILKKKYPSMQFLNLGGGIPPVTSGYDYENYLRRILSGISEMAGRFGCEVPTIVFEFGSFLAEECGFYVHRVLQEKKLSAASDVRWAVVDGGLMAEMPDVFITDRTFPVFAANNAHEKGGHFILGDLSCDSDGRYPLKTSAEPYIDLPVVKDDDQLVVFAGVGSYQKMLGGAGGAHHCGILNAGQLIVEEVSGKTVATYVPSQTAHAYAELLGYQSAVTIQVKKKKRQWFSSHFKNIVGK